MDLTENWMNEADARLAGRLRRILETPGISDKDRKLMEENLKRLLTASRTLADGEKS